MKKEIKTTKEVTKYEFYCDDCGTKENNSSSVYICKCHLCGKHICNKCIGHTDDSIGDYPDYYCKECWSIGESYKEQIQNHEDEIDRLYDEWHAKCKK